MTFWRLIISSLKHYRGVNLSVLAGVALTSAILSGALVVGDSVKESLRRNAANRISQAGPALVGGERFLTAEIADKVAKEIGNNALVAPLLQIEGTVSSRAGNTRANQVQIIGVDDRFWKLSNTGAKPEALSGSDWMAINQPLAERLGSKVKDTLIVRVEIPGAISKDAPLSGESEQTTPFTETINEIISADEFGHYSLRSEQVPPASIFVPLSRLQEILEQPGSANVFLGGNSIETESFRSAFEEAWSLQDIALSLSTLKEGGDQLLSARVFIDQELVDAISKINNTTSPVLTYLATDIAKGGKSTPYSMIAGTGPGLNTIVGKDLKENEIILSDWMAEDLEASVGDEITVSYNVVETGRKLVEQSAKFTVTSIAPLGENGWDQSWTPNFPGIFDVEDLDEWEPGIPIDRDKIRDKDEEFWDTYRATPKAFISLEAARNLWTNRFGNTTAVRLSEAGSPGAFANQLRKQITLSDLGISYRDLAEEARSAVNNSFDFGQLFAYMSFFLIIAALVLAGLIFLFGIEQRRSQIGLLLALGMTRSKIRNLFIRESLLLAIPGALLGLLGGYLYTRLALSGMSGAWKDAAAGIQFVYFVKPVSLAISIALTLFFTLVTVWFASRRVMRFQPSELITGSTDESSVTVIKPVFKSKAFYGAIACALLGIGLLFAPKDPGSMAEQGLFFGVGFLLTLAGIFLASLIISRFAKPSDQLKSLSSLGRQHTVRRRGRSLAVIGLMAAGVFMVTAINSFRLDGERGADRRESGTGGFDFAGVSTLPIYEDLNSDEGRKKYGLDQIISDGKSVSILPFRVSDGDDASCLNLNRAQRPRLMAVDPGLIAGLNPFSFMKSAPSENLKGWEMLRFQPGEGGGEHPVIPGIIDQNTATYALKMGIGDRIVYETGNGRKFSVEIVALLNTSLLQGSLIIAESDFIRFFPDSGGYSYFLLDGPDSAINQKAAEHLTRMFGDRGLEMRPAADRLNEFNAVQNTYLSIFSTLGGLGVLLGTLGLAIIVGRNVLERRGQLGVMQAMGFTRNSLAGMVLAEHWFLHCSGVLLGLAAAVVAVYPKLETGLSTVPIGLLGGINGAILVGGLIFCALAARFVLRGSLMEGIRTE